MARFTPNLVLFISFFFFGRALGDMRPFCGKIPSGNPPKGWKLWTDPSAWAGGKIPGKGQNAVVPCDIGVILNVQNLVLDKLIVNGWLKVQDKGPFKVSANFVIIQGRLTIGTPAVPYSGKITFNLTGSGSEYYVTDGGVSRSIGIKAFAVVGGLVEMNGMYKNQRSWSTLKSTAYKGSRQLKVESDLTGWPIGGTIAIASTDFNYKQAETRKIVGIRVNKKRVTTITLDRPLDYMHWGDPIATGVKGVYMSQSAEVALLTRSIVIQGSPHPWDPLIGGHFIVYHTAQKQQIFGIELVNMGQQGILGRYPMHFHMCDNVKGATVTKISVHDSLQRCIVVHSTHFLNVEGNVGFNTQGHCFIVEDGNEHDNNFVYNLGFSTEPVQRLIPQEMGGAQQSDTSPSTFWISTPANKWINNVAAGGYDSGYWFELAEKVLGPSAFLDSSKNIFPKFLPMMKFSGNAAHSYMRTGLRTYAIGYRPRVNGGVSAIPSPINAPAVDVVIKNFRGFKNAMDGMFIHETDSIIIDGAMMADNAVIAIELHQVEHCIVQNSIILGETANIGNPSQCTDGGNEYANCRALSGCQFPVDPKKARSAGAGQTKRLGPTFGILIDQSEVPSHGLTINGNSQGAPLPQHFRNVTFGKFDGSCRVAAAITANGKTPNVLFSAGHSSRSLTFLDKSPRLYMAPRYKGILGFETEADAGPLADMYVFRDEDGSLIGGKGGYAVTNTNALLPYGKGACKKTFQDYAWACPNTCYRSVAFETRGLFSNPVFTITRAQDGTSFKLYAQSSSTNFLNLLAGSAYKIQIDPTPESLKMWFGDPEGCKGSVFIQLVAPPNKKWTSPSASWRQCAGSTRTSPSVFQLSYICKSGQPPLLQIDLGGQSQGSVTLSTEGGAASCTSLQCGLVPNGGRWAFNDNGARLSSPGWSSGPFNSWKVGNGFFGYGGETPVTRIRSGNEMGGITWYFKTNFGYRPASCMKQLKFGIMVNDGVVAYINGREIYRSNMPGGQITADTPAWGTGREDYRTPPFTEVTLDVARANLRNGDNTLAVEVHTHHVWAWNVRFDMWLTGLGSSCSAANFYK